MDSKRKNIYIVIFIITTIVASCVAVYFGINGDKKNKELQAKVDELTASNNLTENIQQVEQNTNNNVESQEKVVEKAIIPIFDTSKIKNKPDNINYSGKIMYGQAVENLWPVINPDGSVEINRYENGDTISLKVKGLNGKVIDICQSTLSDGANEGIVFLTEDGSVYMVDNIYSALQGNLTLNVKKLPNVSNICRILATMSSNSRSCKSYIYRY